ncbi:MAG: anti-sigma-factor antagonist, partial [Bacteroidetes bacterium]|nr:anti-sigma-factor antagonist [Bacteroidota bacterium]
MSEFTIAQRERESVHVLDLKGYLDAHTAPKLEEVFQALLKSQRYNIIINCKDL